MPIRDFSEEKPFFFPPSSKKFGGWVRFDLEELSRMSQEEVYIRTNYEIMKLASELQDLVMLEAAKFKNDKT